MKGVLKTASALSGVIAEKASALKQVVERIADSIEEDDLTEEFFNDPIMTKPGEPLVDVGIKRVVDPVRHGLIDAIEWIAAAVDSAETTGRVGVVVDLVNGRDVQDWCKACMANPDALPPNPERIRGMAWYPIELVPFGVAVEVCYASGHTSKDVVNHAADREIFKRHGAIYWRPASREGE